MILQTQNELKRAYPMMFEPLEDKSYTLQKEVDAEFRKLMFNNLAKLHF